MSGSRQPYARRSKERPAQVTYCIVVEGERTEKNYFTDAKTEFQQLQRKRMLERINAGQHNVVAAVLTVEVAGGRSFENVVRKALDQVGLGYKKIWCVVDADFYVRLQGKQRRDADATYRSALEAGIDIIFSRPCFEVWYRHHFNPDSSALVDGDRAKKEVQRIWPEYLTKPERHWELLRDRLPDHALPNARRVRTAHGRRPVEECDSSTDVDWLIYELFCQIDPNDPTTV
jgi:hypothetical protein